MSFLSFLLVMKIYFIVYLQLVMIDFFIFILKKNILIRIIMKKTLVKDIYSYYEVINNTFKLFINHIFEMFDNEK